MIMRTLVIVTVLLGLADTGAAQVVRCKLSVYHVGYGLGGSCAAEAVETPAGSTRTNRSRFWPTGPVDIFVAAKPGSPNPVPGLFFQSNWTDPFQLDLEPIGSGASRAVIRTGGATLLVDEWNQVNRDAVSLVFHLNFAPATRNDVEILRSALSRFNTAKTWNRSGDQNCEDDTPGDVSLFCALQVAVTSKMGRYHHAQAAIDVVRAIISEQFRDRPSGHNLVDFNNNAKTTAAEVRAVLEAAISRALSESAEAK
jgi:hypothetical protein